ncbi:MAG: hypothetical protein KJO21_02160 [Verrucomicrobiae bacterium]|nr:hypothetical protein [Verrucomicrobiae bacterium]NNJ44103.1 hypothetical protein [Akkermansiaceae bacterium]
MSKVFGTIAVVILAVAAFIAWKNMDALVREAGNKKEDPPVEGRLQVAQKLEKSTIKELAAQRKRRDDAAALRDSYTAETVKIQAELDEVTAKYDDAVKKVESLKKQHKNNEFEIANANEVLKGLPDHNELVPKVRRMRSELSDATNGIATQEARLANLTQQDDDAKAKIASNRAIMKLQSSGQSFPSLKTRISSIYRNWGFVILAAGDTQGVVSGSLLDVMRGGEVIAKLKVTAVEAGRASADIILDSVAEGTTLRSGDTVVAEKKEEQLVSAP